MILGCETSIKLDRKTTDAPTQKQFGVSEIQAVVSVEGVRVYKVKIDGVPCIIIDSLTQALSCDWNSPTRSDCNTKEIS